MADGFWALAQRDPARVALVLPDGEEVSAGELLAASNRVVHGLRARGLAPGAAIAVASGNRRELVELHLAVSQAGFYLVPVNVRLAAREIAHVLHDSGASAFVFDGATAAAARAAVESTAYPAEACFALDPSPPFAGLDALTRGQPAEAPADRTLGGTMFYTSGTTGLPKAVRRPLKAAPPDKTSAALARMRLSGASAKASEDAVHLVVAPLYHSAALAWCSAHLHLGHLVVLMDEWSPQGMLERVARYRVTGVLMVPTHFVRLLALPEDARSAYDVSSLRHVVHGGAPCPVSVKRRMMEWWGPVLHEVYGAAEAAGGTYVGPKEWLERPGTVGKARGQVRILREDGAACEPNEVGVVYFDSHGQHFEYLNDPTKTEASRRVELFTVGDLGYLDEDGYLFLSDRQSDVVISGGVNVYPAEVEAVLMGHPKVRDAAVFGVPDDEWGERLKAVVEAARADEAGDELARELTAYCREHLAGFKCPRSIDFVASLPRAPNGKLYKRQLRDPHWAGRERKI